MNKDINKTLKSIEAEIKFFKQLDTSKIDKRSFVKHALSNGICSSNKKTADYVIKLYKASILKCDKTKSLHYKNRVIECLVKKFESLTKKMLKSEKILKKKMVSSSKTNKKSKTSKTSKTSNSDKKRGETKKNTEKKKDKKLKPKFSMNGGFYRFI